MKLSTFICFSIYLLCCLSCAKQGIPSGGPKDSIPPILISSIPQQKQLNFKGKEVKLVFSEYVMVNNPKEQIIITPSVSKDFKATTKNQTVTLEFENAFDDSTTYTFNFRDAIKDITEKNSARNLKLAFSTGSYIDSISIDGKVYDLLKDKEIKDATVALYENADTFNIFKDKPVYLTKTNEKGIFKLENLKNGLYHIYAFDDKNKNLKVESKNESYGFLSAELNLNKDIKNIALPIIRLDSRPLKIMSARPYNNYFNIRTSKSITDYTITSSADSSSIISSFGDDNSNVRIYNTLDEIDSLQIKFSAKDSIENSIDTVLYIKFNKREIKPEKFITKIESNKVEANTGLLTIKISFNKPVAEIDFDSIYLRPDTTMMIKFIDKDFTWDFLKNKLLLQKTLEKKLFIKEEPEKQKKPPTTTKEIKEPQTLPKPTLLKPKEKLQIKNQFYMGKAAFISIDDDSSKVINDVTKIIREEETGIILVNIKTKEPNFICQLLNDYKVVDYRINKKEIVFQNLQPSNYTIRFIADHNGNGKWDPGNFFLKAEPEPIIFFKNEKNKGPIINLKANWEVGPLLITY